MNLTKYVYDICQKHYKTLMKELHFRQKGQEWVNAGEWKIEDIHGK